ncbi:MAG: NDP-sugar synthase [Thermoleophilia bacterium]|nr:NDP-sugar synthase [Thermoleophilia bacterium]
MRAMIMAAGIGTRLRPLTELVPKPMAPIVNRPALYHILRLLRLHGVREVVINLHHLPDAITSYFGDGSALGMEIRYSYEPELLGTAGGVKNNADFLGVDTFLVLSGDALTDVDLTGLISAHRRHGGLATMAVKEVLDPTQYGVVVANDEDRVVGFQEKPSLEEAKSRLCNCGIYVFEPEILSHIPEGRFDDFGRRVFPDLVRQHAPFYIYEVSGYWSDVGNVREYLRGNADALAGRVAVEVPGQQVRPGVWMEEGAKMAASVRLEAPVLIGKGCVIEEGAIIEGPCVLGEGCSVGPRAWLSRCVLLPGVTVPAGAMVMDGVLAQNSWAGAPSGSA